MTIRKSHFDISDFTITTAPVPDADEPLFYGKGNKCEAIFLTPDASKATVLPGTAPGSPDSLPLTVEVNLDWKGRKEIPVVASDEIYVKRTKQVALDAVCQWANSNHLPAVYYSQPGGDNELLIMDTNQVEINVSKHHIHYPKPTADIDAMHQSGYAIPKPHVGVMHRAKPPRPPRGMPHLPGR